MVNLAAMVWRRLLRKRWVLALVFGLSLVYFLSSTFKQVSGRPSPPPLPFFLPSSPLLYFLLPSFVTFLLFSFLPVFLPLPFLSFSPSLPSSFLPLFLPPLLPYLPPLFPSLCSSFLSAK